MTEPTYKQQLLNIPSLDVLVAHLNADPFLQFRMRVMPEGNVDRWGAVKFCSFSDGLFKFRDARGHLLMLNFRSDPRGCEWGLRFFPGGFRFRKPNMAVTFYFARVVAS